MTVPSREIEKALFDAALNLPDPSVRAAFLAQACGDNAPLRERLSDLLAAATLADDFFDLPPPPIDELISARPAPGGAATGSAHPRASAAATASALASVSEAGAHSPSPKNSTPP